MNNMVKAVSIICATALAIFLLYQFMFSPYARCVSAGKEIINVTYELQDVGKIRELKYKCVNAYR